MGLCAVLLTGCTGFGVPNAEEQAREGHRAYPTKPGNSVFTALSSGSRVVETRLSPGIGKSKDEHIRMFGQPFQCIRPSQGSEICGWQDPKISEGASGGSEELAYYVYDERGVAFAWYYRGAYGNRNSLDAILPVPAPSP